MEEIRVYTIRDLLLLFLEYLRELRKRWYVYVIAFLVFGLFYTYKVLTSIPEYPAEVTYIIKGDEGNPLGGAASILSQFGIGLGKTSFNLKKISSLATSDRILRESVLETDTVNGRADLLANHIIEIYTFDEEWEEKEKTELVGYRFRNDTIKGNDLTENKVLNQVVAYIKGSENRKGLLSSSYDELSGIMNIKVTTWSQDLSYALAMHVFYNLQEFYRLNSLEGQVKTHEVIREKRDSLYAELVSTESALAKAQDNSRGVFLYETRLRQLQLERERQKLTTMYAEAVKNYEIADFTLRNNRPVLQLIDSPLLPIKGKAFKPRKAIVLTLLLTVLVGTLVIVFWKIIRDALKSNPD